MRRWLPILLFLASLLPGCAADQPTTTPSRPSAQTTRLAFGPAQVAPAPTGWRLRDAALSPDGRYVAALLADGAVGWWALDGSGQGRHEVAGYDLRWHPTEARFAFLSAGRRLHLVQVGPEVKHLEVEAPGTGELRYPHFGGENLPTELSGRDPSPLMLVADPAGAPQGFAYLPASDEWATFSVNRTPQTWEQVEIPTWIADPWSPNTDYLVIRFAYGPALAHPDAGTPALFFQPTADAEPLTLVWSPRGHSYAVVERRDGDLVAHLLRLYRDDDGNRFSLPLETEQIALSDDGVTTVTIRVTGVEAKNHLTGKVEHWPVDGEILGLRWGLSHLLIVQAERVIIRSYAQR